MAFDWGSLIVRQNLAAQILLTAFLLLGGVPIVLDAAVAVTKI